MRTITTNIISPWNIKNGKALAPVLIAIEGVHSGSEGPLFWTAEVLKNSVKKFNNIPITMRHPTDCQGQFVSIHENPAITTQYLRGVLKNPRFDATVKGIRARIEVPVNIQDFGLVQGTKNVSLGVFTNEEGPAGEWNGRYYTAKVVEIQKADHLALLPDQTPACVGTGIQVNTEKLFRDALATIIQEREDQIMDEALFPAGVQTNVSRKEEEQKLTALQTAAEKDGLLLPTQFNKSAATSTSQATQDEAVILMPAGY